MEVRLGNTQTHTHVSACTHACTYACTHTEIHIDKAMFTIMTLDYQYSAQGHQ